MAKTDFKSVDEHIATQPEDVRATLRRVRNTLRKVVPGAEESISYQIPTYKLHGDPVLYFAGWEAALLALPRHRARQLAPRACTVPEYGLPAALVLTMARAAAAVCRSPRVRS
jgi:uncharacterized protein YdhG (YjbR/CyaY superfamily)